MIWKKLGEKYLFQHKPWLTIREDKLQMPNGHIMESYYLFEYPDWVNTIAIDKEGNFILVEQYRHAVGQYGIELCAGVCDEADGTPLVSAQRELLEETGYGGGSWEYFMTTSANPGTHTNRVHGYIARNVEKLAEQSLDGTEEIIVHILKREEVIKLLKEDKFLQSLHASILWKYFALVDPV